MGILYSLFDAALAPFRSVAPYWPLTVLAVIVAAGTLLVVGKLSNQARITTTKNAIKAHLLELWLFRDDVRTVLLAQVHIIRLNVRYVGLTLKPMLVLLIPLTLIVAALEPWFGMRPLRPGEAAIVSLRAADANVAANASLVTGDGVVVETPPLRIASTNEIDWRVRVLKNGVHTVSVEVGGQTVDKQIVASDQMARVMPSRTTSFWEAFLNPGEATLPDSAAIERIDVHYPAGSVNVFGWEMHWLVFFIAACFVFVLALRRPMRVEI
jgi:hypothetical protein